MDARVRHFLENTVRSIVALDATLFFQSNPETFDTVHGLAMRIHYKASELEPALERLAARGILDSFPRGDDRYRCYALSTRPEVWDLLCRLSEAYIDDPETRQEIVRLLILIHAQEKAVSKRGEDDAKGMVE